MKKLNKKFNKKNTEYETTEYCKGIPEQLYPASQFTMGKSNELIEHKSTGKTNEKTQDRRSHMRTDGAGVKRDTHFRKNEVVGDIVCKIINHYRSAATGYILKGL